MSETINLAAGFEPPTMSDFFPPALMFAGTPFAIDRITLIRLIMSALLLVLFVAAAQRARLVPRGLQNVVEVAIDFVRVNIAEEILGKKYARAYLPILSFVFFIILFLNITSIIPFMNISPNARIAMPLVLALFAYCVYIIVGIKQHGLKYFKDMIIVSGVPSWLHILLVPIELISNFILRPFTLTVRLMANMLSGHMLLALFFAATQFFFFGESIPWMKSFGLGSLLFAILFTFFEILVAFLQAYIFSLLVAVYIDSSIHAGEH